jgi:hypothetical protein
MKNTTSRKIVANLALRYRKSRGRFRKHKQEDFYKSILAAEKAEAWNAYVVSKKILNGDL